MNVYVVEAELDTGGCGSCWGFVSAHSTKEGADAAAKGYGERRHAPPLDWSAEHERYILGARVTGPLEVLP